MREAHGHRSWVSGLVWTGARTLLSSEGQPLGTDHVPQLRLWSRHGDALASVPSMSKGVVALAGGDGHAASGGKDGSVKVRFFGIFTTGSVDSTDTYSCNVTATGVPDAATGEVTITKLSCAKDEGWGRSVDLI